MCLAYASNVYLKTYLICTLETLCIYMYVYGRHAHRKLNIVLLLDISFPLYQEISYL